MTRFAHVSPEARADLREALADFRGHVKDHDKFRKRLDEVESQVEQNMIRIAEAFIDGNLAAAAVAQQEANEYVDRVADPIRAEVAGERERMARAYATLDYACHKYVVSIMPGAPV